jgi:hypothetical protein
MMNRNNAPAVMTARTIVRGSLPNGGRTDVFTT